MAGGPIFPNIEPYPVNSGLVFPQIHETNTNTRHYPGLGVIASLGSNATWEVRWRIPETLPTGTSNLRLTAVANGTGNAQVNPTWNRIPAGSTLDIASLTAEGTTAIAITPENQVVTDIVLDAHTLVAGDLVVMDLVLESTGWTLAAPLTFFQPEIVWL